MFERILGVALRGVYPGKGETLAGISYILFPSMYNPILQDMQDMFGNNLFSISKINRNDYFGSVLFYRGGIFIWFI